MKALRTGEQVPDMIVNNVFNFKESSLNLSSFNKKLIILDFWATTCASCVKSFPKLEALQKEFNDDIQIILVNSQSLEATRIFFEKLKKVIKIPDLPFFTADTIFKKMFPNHGVPYLIWLDKDKRLRFKTDNHHANSKRITEFLSTGAAEMDQKKYIAGRFDSQSLFNDGKYKMKYHSILANCIQGVRMDEGVGLRENKTIRITRKCISLANLLRIAYTERNKYNFALPSSIIFEVKDSFQFTEPNDSLQLDYWTKNFSYFYELVLPESKKDDLFLIMQQDLSRYFDIDVTIEKRYLNCMVLVRTGSFDKLQSKGGPPIHTMQRTAVHSWVNDSIRILQNRPFKKLTEQLSSWFQYQLKTYFVDETGYHENIDISILGDVIDSLDVGALRKALQKYDLDLVEKKVERDVLLVREKEMKKL